MLSSRRKKGLLWNGAGSILYYSGPSIIMPENAPHANAVRLFVEWFLSSEGRRVDEQISGYGFANAGSGSRLSEMVKGHTLVVRTEEVILKAVELELDNKFTEMLVDP